MVTNIGWRGWFAIVMRVVIQHLAFFQTNLAADVANAIPGTRLTVPRPSTAQLTLWLDIREQWFEPAVLVVVPGDRITWINKDPLPHTVTANAKAFDSGNLTPATSWSWVTQSSGTYAYRCLLHPTMKGELIVKARTDAGDRR
jgi:plastocyanin